MKISEVEGDKEYTFHFDKNEVLVSDGLKMMVMPLSLIKENSEPWQYLRDEYIKIPAKLAIKIEAICNIDGI